MIENEMGSSLFKPVEFDGFKNKWARGSFLDKCLYRGIEVLLPFFAFLLYKGGEMERPEGGEV